MILADSHYDVFYTADERDTLDRYAANRWIYYTDPRLDSEAINLFVQLMRIFGDILSKHAFELKRQVLARQAQAVN